jgi:hypothetical protein
MFICSGVSITSDITGTKQIGFSFIYFVNRLLMMFKISLYSSFSSGSVKL